MKILWLCNSRFSQCGLSETGTWLQPLAETVNGAGDFTVVNVTFGSVPEITSEEIAGMKQYVIPSALRLKTDKAGWAISRIISDENPDLVHIWGTENIWGNIYVAGYIKKPAFMEMQGMKSYHCDYYGGLTRKEIVQCNFAPMTLYAPGSSLYTAYKRFKKDGLNEIKILQAFDKISVQSRWVEDHVRAINPRAEIYRTKIILREPFYSCEQWHWKECGDAPVIFSTSSSSTPYKGMHILIRAVALLKREFPKIQLNIAGSFMSRRGAFFSSGYSRYLLGLMKELNVEDNINFLGPINAGQIIKQLQAANVCVIPSFIETYCVALAEAMMVGTPCVVSYAGAMPEFATPDKEALFYTSVDNVSCARRIRDCLTNRTLSERLSDNGRKRKMEDCDKNKMLAVQLDNYQKILMESK